VYCLGDLQVQGRRVQTGLDRRRNRQAQTSVSGVRATTLASGVLDKLDAESILQETRRLLTDLEHHVQRLHDLVYDSVSLELGGSE